MATPRGSGADRRQHSRKPLRSQAHLMLANRSPMAVRTVDIGAEGAGIVVAMNLPTHLSGTLRLSIPLKRQGTSVIEVQVTVAHSILSRHEDGFLVGLQFSHVPVAAVTVIAQFLKP